MLPTVKTGFVEAEYCRHVLRKHIELNIGLQKNIVHETLIVHYVKFVAKILRIPKTKIDMNEQNGNHALGIQITGNDSI
jgi:hypothetical protein